MHRHALIKALLAGIVPSLFGATHSQAQIPDAIAAPGEIEIGNFHAEGAQIYECKADASGKLVWEFREPIATLIAGGRTAGRHYAGPTWELRDGSAIVGKVEGRSPGGSPKDIPWLKLSVASSRGNGQLSGTTTIQRINTKGGNASGPCNQAGEYLSVPYSSDYRFLKKG